MENTLLKMEVSYELRIIIDQSGENQKSTYSVLHISGKGILKHQKQSQAKSSEFWQAFRPGASGVVAPEASELLFGQRLISPVHMTLCAFEVFSP